MSNVSSEMPAPPKRANDAQMDEAARAAAGKRRSRRPGRTSGAQARHPRDILAIVVAHVIVKGHTVARRYLIDLNRLRRSRGVQEDYLDLLTAPLPASR